MNKNKYICYSLDLKRLIRLFSLTKSSIISCLTSDTHLSSKLGHVWLRCQCVSSMKSPWTLSEENTAWRDHLCLLVPYSWFFFFPHFGVIDLGLLLQEQKYTYLEDEMTGKRWYYFSPPWKFSFQRKLFNTIIMLVIIKVCLEALRFYNDVCFECQSQGETFHVIH